MAHIVGMMQPPMCLLSLKCCEVSCAQPLVLESVLWSDAGLGIVVQQAVEEICSCRRMLIRHVGGQ